MKRTLPSPLWIIFTIFPIFLNAQDKLEFGKIDIKDLKMKSYDKDSTAPAVILADVGKTYYENSSGLVMIFEKHTRIKIFNSSYFYLANGEIPIYSDGSTKEVIKDFEAITYNLENGQVVKNKLTKEGIFNDRVVDDYEIKKFAMPNVKEGCIIEYKYKIKSDFVFNIRKWYFQDVVPTRWSEYTFEIPDFFFFNKNFYGYHPLTYTGSKEEYRYLFPGKGQSKVTVFRLGGKDMPAFVNEPYISSPKNFITQIDLEISAIQLPNMVTPLRINDWDKIIKRMKNFEKFGLQLNKHGLVKKQIDSIDLLYQDEQEKMIAIYNYVKGHIKWNGQYSVYTEKGVKKAFDERAGNVAEVNLFLTLMLKDAGFNVCPVISSTRENGIVNFFYPILERYNYVMAHVKIKDKFYLLDATDLQRPYNILPERAINGRGKLINNVVESWVDLRMDEMENTRYTFYLKLEEDGNLQGKIKKSEKSYSAYVLRKSIAENNFENYIESLKNNNRGWNISDYKIENLENINEALNESFQISLPNYANSGGDKFYVDPIFIKELKVNPFISEVRNYPVDFAYPRKKDYVVELTLPDGYKLVEKLAPTIIVLPENEAKFSFSVTELGNKVHIVSSLSINKTLFLTEEYPTVKKFFELVSKKLSEQLVIQKL